MLQARCFIRPIFAITSGEIQSPARAAPREDLFFQPRSNCQGGSFMAERLPIYEIESEILARLKQDRRLILSAPTGSGKSILL
jgi:HrpA-like RNA helicase